MAPTESSVTCEGARCCWDPDAHFAILRVREAWAQLAERRRRGVSGNVPEKLNAFGEDAPFSGNSGDILSGGPRPPPGVGVGPGGGANARGGFVDPLERSGASGRSRETPSGVSGKFPEKLNADPGGFVFSGNARDDETGVLSARPAADDGSAGGSGLRGDSAGSSAGAASSARAQHGASGVSGKFPETSTGPRLQHEAETAKPVASLDADKNATDKNRDARDAESKKSAFPKKSASTKKRWSTSVRFVDARFEADITPGASVALSAASFQTDPETRALEFERLAATVNGRVVVAAARAACAVGDVDVDVDAETKKRRETFSFDETIAKRRSVDVTATSPRLALPHGLDLGDAALAAQVGVDAFRAFLSPRGEDQDRDQDAPPRRKTETADAEKPKPFFSTQVTLRVVGSLVADAFDSPTARSLRVKQAVLEPLLARARARDAAERLRTNASTPRRETKKAYAAEASARTRAFILAARAAALKAEGAAFADEERPVDFLRRFSSPPNETKTNTTKPREETEEETIESVARGLAVSAAGSVTLGHGSVVACVFGGDVKKATRFCSRVDSFARDDAPSEHSQNVSNEASRVLMEIKRAFHASCDLHDVAVTLPGAPAPLFAAKRLEVTGPVAQARRRRRRENPDAFSRENTNDAEPNPKTPVRLAVGRRRFVAAKPPDAPRLPPVRTYTDVDVRLERARACHAVHCEPALVSFVRELLRLTPPPGARHAAAPGGGGGRDAAAARVAAAWRAAKRTNDWKGFDRFEPSMRCVADDRAETLLCAPLLPLWDVARAVWRGEARFFARDFAATLDADFGYFKRMRITADPDLSLSHDDSLRGDISEEPLVGDDRSVPARSSEMSLADRGRLEMSAAKAAMDLAPGAARVKVARLAFAAAGTHYPYETSQETLETDLERLRASEVQLAVIPAFECVVKHAWRSLGVERNRDEDHPAARFGVGVDAEVAVTLTTKDAVVKAWREAEKARWMTEDSAAGGDDASASEKISVGASSEKSPIARWMSGDFEPATRRPTRGAASDSRARANAPTPNAPTNARTNAHATRPATASPRSPAFGSKSPESCVSPTFATVSSAAAASVADASVTPTLIAGPAAISWARRFAKTVARPPGARRRAWTTPTRGVDAMFKKPKHPLATPFAKLFDAVEVTVTADQLRAAHPAERPDDPARGLVAHASGARGAFSFARADSLEENRRDVSSSLRVDLEEIRVLLPPSGVAGDEHSCSSREETPTTPGAWRRWATGSIPRTPGSASSSPSARRFFPGGDLFPGAAGDFDEEAARYEAVAAMLSGSALEPIAGDAFERVGLSTDDGELAGGNATTGNAFDRERKRRRPRATDPALVLETRSVTLSRGSREKQGSGEGEGEARARVDKKANPDLSEMDFVSDSVFTRVRVESPRLLKAAARRDALVRWARDAWRAATAPETPSHSLSSLEALVNSSPAGETPGNCGNCFPRDAEDAKDSFEVFSAREETGIVSREDDESSRETILFVVDVAAPQFNFEGKDGTGRVLVAATAGRVVGRLVESSLQNRKEVTIALEKAQAHVAPTDVDVYAGVQWLDESAFVVASETSRTSLETETETSERSVFDRDAKAKSGYLLRRVFEPCSMDLAFVTKEPPKEAKGAVRKERSRAASRDGTNATEPEPETETETEPHRDDSPRRKGKGKPPPSALTEFALKSPEIEAELTAEQFAALVDVVGSVFLAQLVDEPPPPAIAAARLLANTNRSLVDAEDRASAAVVAAPLARHRRATWRLNAGLADESESLAANRVGEFPRASAVSLALRHALRDAESEVAEAIEKAEALVRPNRRRPAISLRLEIARFRWAMRSGGRSFLVARVEALRLARERHSDTSGTTALKLGDLKLDVPAPASAAIVARGADDKKKQSRVVFTKPGFARWDPDAPEDESFRGAFAGGFSASRSFGVQRERERSAAEDGSTDRSRIDEDAERRRRHSVSKKNASASDAFSFESSAINPLVTVDARRAASPPEAPVWDAIEVSVEPFSLNLESETYGTLHRYLFPEKRSNESLRGGKGERAANRAAFERGLEALASSSRGRTSKSSGNETELSFSFPGSSVASASERAPDAEAKARAMLLGAPFFFEKEKKKGKHARAKTWGADFFGGGGGVPVAEPRQFSTPTKPRRGRALTAPEGKPKNEKEKEKAAGVRDPVTFRSTLAERAPRPFPLAVDASDAKGGGAFSTREIVSSSSAAAALAAGPAVGAFDEIVSKEHLNPAETAPKVVVVKYLKVNDVALKVSYDGPPKAFHEVRLLLDASTHANFVGRWRELIDKIKKNMVWSVLKSVTGLQGRRLPGGAAAAAAGASASDGAPEERSRERSSRAPFGGKNPKLGVALVSDGGGGIGIGGGSDHFRTFEGFEGFEGDLDFAEGLTALGSPTAAAMVAESDGLVVPAGRRGATFSVWRSFFGGGGGGDANTAKDKNKDKDASSDDAEGRGTRVHDGPDSGDAADDRAALLASWGKRR